MNRKNPFWRRAAEPFTEALGPAGIVGAKSRQRPFGLSARGRVWSATPTAILHFMPNPALYYQPLRSLRRLKLDPVSAQVFWGWKQPRGCSLVGGGRVRAA